MTDIQPKPESAPAPPSGCPAHGSTTGALQKLYGPELETNAAQVYRRLREEYGAVAPVELPGEVPAWLVLGYRENLDVARNPTRFGRDPRIWNAIADGRVTPTHPLAPITAYEPLCAFADGEEHKRLRSAVTDSLSRLDQRGIRRYVKRYAVQLIAAFAENGSADLVEQFAMPLPMLVMTKLVGMPEAYGPRILEAAQDMVSGSATALESNAYIVERLQELVEDRKTHPATDIATSLLTHDSKLTDQEVVEHLRLILIAAYLTTASLVVNTLHTVLTDKRFRGNLKGGTMTLPDALEQVLWDAPPFTAVYGRWATGETELAGQHIKQGDMLVLGLAAGNTDPQVRPDLTSSVLGNRSHLAFSGGPHECPGQDIGRAIADTGIYALMDTLPDLALTVAPDELSWRTTVLVTTLQALPVAFSPTAVADSTPLEQASPATAELAVLPTQSSVDRSQREHANLWRRLLAWLQGEHL